MKSTLAFSVRRVLTCFDQSRDDYGYSLLHSFKFESRSEAQDDVVKGNTIVFEANVSGDCNGVICNPEINHVFLYK